LLLLNFVSLNPGDVLAVFSQYGEVVDVNLVRDKETKKSKGFAFLAYEDQVCVSNEPCPCPFLTLAAEGG
jgi:RNA recognition motif-containing protein